MDVIEELKALESGTITDALGLLGVGGWMDDIFPVNPASKMVGRAFTIQCAVESNPDVKAYPYYELLDYTEPGQVAIIAANNYPKSLIGENVQHASKKMGLAGVLIDGRNRDNPIISEYDLPVFSRGRSIGMVPKNFKMIAYNVPVMCGGVCVHPGDYIIGDMDGVIVLPQQYAEKAIELAKRITDIETEMEQAINSGKPMKECLAVISQKGKLKP